MAKAKVDQSELKTIISEEIKPLKESINTLTEENAVLKESLAEAEKKSTSLMAEVTTLSEKLKKVTLVAKGATDENNSLREVADTLKKRNGQLVAEMKSVNESASRRVKIAEAKAEADKQAFVNKITEGLERQVGDSIREAFMGAKTLFENDMNAVHTDLLADLGKLLAPYIADPSLPRRTEVMRKAVKEAKAELVTAAKNFRDYQLRKETENRKLASKLGETVKALNEAKFSAYKDRLVQDLPDSTRKIARAKLNEAKNAEDAKNILLTFIRESAATGGAKSTQKPVVVKEAAKAPGGDQRMEKILTESLGRSEVDASEDPELLKLAGLLRKS